MKHREISNKNSNISHILWPMYPVYTLCLHIRGIYSAEKKERGIIILLILENTLTFCDMTVSSVSNFTKLNLWQYCHERNEPYIILFTKYEE